MLLNCCHAGGFAPAGSLGVGGFRPAPLPPDILKMFEHGSGRAVIASSQAGELSWTGTPYCVFTGALLEGLAGYGALERNGVAELMDVVRWLGSKVPERTGDKQHPVLDFAQVTASFPLAYYAAGGTQPVPLAWSTAALAATLPEPPVTPIPESTRFIDAMAHLTEGEFRAVVSGMGYLWSTVGSADQLASAVTVYDRATRPSRTKERNVALLRTLILLYYPEAFADA